MKNYLYIIVCLTLQGPIQTHMGFIYTVYLVMAGVFFSLCLGLYFITTATAGVSETGVKCRVELDRGILPAGVNQNSFVILE